MARALAHNGEEIGDGRCVSMADGVLTPLCERLMHPKHGMVVLCSVSHLRRAYLGEVDHSVYLEARNGASPNNLKTNEESILTGSLRTTQASLLC